MTGIEWKEIKEYAASKSEILTQLLYDLTTIPAPGFSERKKADYCLNWLKKQGIGEGILDTKGNVIVTYGFEENSSRVLFMAHLDTVFPMETRLKVRQEGSLWFCPGIGDNTANVVALMGLILYVFEKRPSLPWGIIFALSVCEEGLGNLEGCRELMRNYGHNLSAVVSYDLYCSALYDKSIGSVRYQVSIHTKGGHSYLDFGRENAIAVASKIICRLYEFPISGEDVGHTTYNVGTIEGGTSVNAIASDCSFSFEFRLDKEKGLEHAQAYFDKVIAEAQSGFVSVRREVLGVRPCMGKVNEQRMKELTDAGMAVVEHVTGKKPVKKAASTDCNIPLSMGIPAICVGTVVGGGAHTLEEWIDISSLPEAVEITVGMLHCLAMEDTLSYEMRDCLSDEREQEEVLAVLRECDNDFVPPLSCRRSTHQRCLLKTGKNPEGVRAYFNEICRQHTMLLKKNREVIGFLSFQRPYSCPELSSYKKVTYLTTLCIKNAYRGRGLSRSIYKNVLSYINEKYPKDVIAFRTWTTNQAQMHLAKELNMQLAARIKDDRGIGIDTVYYVFENKVCGE